METDFIFSVLGEEFGFLGILFLFFLYFILIYWGIKMSLESKNYFSKIFGVSFIASFFLIIFINVAYGHRHYTYSWCSITAMFLWRISNSFEFCWFWDYIKWI